ncbi:Uncharacterised protein [Vibrio cholerae]|nr:Uncharacterised protein [Vibrio cholerae]CSI50615.1 Uncharacterised protein [Vibrio cholerae]
MSLFCALSEVVWFVDAVAVKSSEALLSLTKMSCRLSARLLM